jgi:HSP20 family protein
MEVRMMTNGVTPHNSLFNHFNALWNELDRPSERTLQPRTDIVEHAEGYHFYFEIPGLKADSADVRVEDGRLVVTAERPRHEWAKDASIHLAERTYGQFKRAFKLPEDASSDGISAAYKDGVLEVTVPKKPESKPVKIKVNIN